MLVNANGKYGRVVRIQAVLSSSRREEHVYVCIIAPCPPPTSCHWRFCNTDGMSFVRSRRYDSVVPNGPSLDVEGCGGWCHVQEGEASLQQSAGGAGQQHMTTNIQERCRGVLEKIELVASLVSKITPRLAMSGGTVNVCRRMTPERRHWQRQQRPGSGAESYSPLLECTSRFVLIDDDWWTCLAARTLHERNVCHSSAMSPRVKRGVACA